MNDHKKLLFIFCTLISITLSAKRMILNKSYTKPFFDIELLSKILQKNPYVGYKKIIEEFYFEYEEFPFCSQVIHKGYFKECFILEIPNGQVQGKEGIVLIDKKFPQEMIWANRYEYLQNVPNIDSLKIQKISGRVAIIAQPGYDNYCHFFYEILSRLAILEISRIQYDWLYIPIDKQFVKEGLRLWGIDESKIIFPVDKSFCIQADTLILPSLVLNTNHGCFNYAGVNAHPYTLRYIREKLLSTIEGKVDTSQYSKRIFISRRDAPTRRILNEDQVFKLFEAKGFQRYDTGKMSIEEQIALFAQAEIVIGEHGAGLTNILFCKKETKVIEIFQALMDTSFWFPAQVFNLNYVPVNALNIDGNIFYKWEEIFRRNYFKSQNSKIEIPLDSIKKIVNSL